ncbi:MAG: 50S ribosomal protein L22 [Nitrospinota bacterium]|nr:50S ribosomal protein L22 [Nitrospinota bacterium]MDH5755556.1 50S ribosomal protein L22 [Nitrospinota bacterium]
MEAIEARATLRYFRVSPYKTRLVANMIRGRKVEDAVKILTFANKKSAQVMLKLLNSAVANAEEKKVEDTGILEVSQVWVCGGPSYRRYMPRARGRADVIRHPTSHITIVVKEDLVAKAEEAKRREEAEAKKAKKRAAKKDADKGAEKKASEPKKAAKPKVEADKAEKAPKEKKAPAKAKAKAPAKKKKED